jgi:hypothetical protein
MKTDDIYSPTERAIIKYLRLVSRNWLFGLALAMWTFGTWLSKSEGVVGWLGIAIIAAGWLPFAINAHRCRR